MKIKKNKINSQLLKVKLILFNLSIDFSFLHFNIQLFFLSVYKNINEIIYKLLLNTLFKYARVNKKKVEVKKKKEEPFFFVQKRDNKMGDNATLQYE